MDELRSFIRDVPNFPKPGIVFKDITPLLRTPKAFATVIDALAEPFRNRNIAAVASIESRGFIFGSCVALALGAGMIPIRKPGKLPWTTRRHEYVLEYGTDVLEIHDDAVTAGDRVLIVDDVLATGGTAGAASVLIRGLGGEVVAVALVIELEFLGGRAKLDGIPVHSVLRY